MRLLLQQDPPAVADVATIVSRVAPRVAGSLRAGRRVRVKVYDEWRTVAKGDVPSPVEETAVRAVTVEWSGRLWWPHSVCVIERVELGNPNGQAEAGYFVRLEHAYGDPAIAARLVGTGTLPVVVRRASL